MLQGTFDVIFGQDAVRKSLAPGRKLLGEGEEGHLVYGLESGVAMVTADTREHGERFLGYRGRRTLLGEMSALEDRPRNATITAVTHCRFLVIPNSRFLEKFADQNVSRELLRAEKEKSMEDDLRRSEWGALLLSERVANELIRLTKCWNSRSITGLNRDRLASLVGAHRTSVYKVLAKLQAQQAIALHRRRIDVLDRLLDWPSSA